MTRPRMVCPQADLCAHHRGQHCEPHDRRVTCRAGDQVGCPDCVWVDTGIAGEQTRGESELLSAVDDLLRIESESGLWDVPGEFWDEGDGYIATNDPTASKELEAVIARLRALRNAANTPPSADPSGSTTEKQ